MEKGSLVEPNVLKGNAIFWKNRFPDFNKPILDLECECECECEYECECECDV